MPLIFRPWRWIQWFKLNHEIRDKIYTLSKVTHARSIIQLTTEIRDLQYRRDHL